MTSQNWQQKFSKASSLPEIEGGIQNLILVRGQDMEGQPQWAYALIPADNYLAFRQAESQGNYHLAEFGTVLHFGPGENPPEEIVREMAENYEANPNFEEELLNIMDQAVDSVLSALEEASQQKES